MEAVKALAHKDFGGQTRGGGEVVPAWRDGWLGTASVLAKRCHARALQVLRFALLAGLPRLPWLLVPGVRCCEAALPTASLSGAFMGNSVQLLS